jgi:hypothetical protein
VDNGGAFLMPHAFYRAVWQWKVSGQEERGSGGGTSMAPVMGVGNMEGEVLRCGCFRR